MMDDNYRTSSIVFNTLNIGLPFRLPGGRITILFSTIDQLVLLPTAYTAFALDSCKPRVY